ncbi:MAG: CoA pyrophosphatase [Candidatus Eisenbacteria bacterium]|nr:CoA pyrophosphatase [Candidatus Eisenbacteria bacterium]
MSAPPGDPDPGASRRETPHRALPPRIARLAARLDQPLPARQAHQLLWPSHLPLRSLDSFDLNYRQAAVLLLLVPTAGGFRIPLIRRPEAMEHHAGQIALPGGEREVDESVEACALREAEEEIGLVAPGLQLLGRLSPIPIPVSRFRVDPLVAFLDHLPTLRAAAGEVDEILLADPDGLTRRGPTTTVARIRDDESIEVPAFEVESAKVWGATGFILAEFCQLWRESAAEPAC